MAKITMKEQILQFVESKGFATYTEIQRFIVDLKYGQGAYDAAANTDLTFDCKTDAHTKKCNPYRGYYSAHLNNNNDSYYGKGYLMTGKDRLEKTADKKYFVIRKTNN